MADLFEMPGISLAEELPVDGSAHGFDKNSDALDTSHVNPGGLQHAIRQADHGEIAVLALDCKGLLFRDAQLRDGCGGQQATPLMNEDIIKVLIDPAKTNLPPLEEALKKRDVQLKEASKPAAPK